MKAGSFLSFNLKLFALRTPCLLCGLCVKQFLERLQAKSAKDLYHVGVTITNWRY